MRRSELIELCLAGDEKAQKRLYDEFAGVVMGVCLRYARSKDLAQDIHQETFIKVFTQLHTLKETEALPGWIKSIAVRTAINYHRKTIKREMITLSELSEANEPSDLDMDILLSLEKQQLISMIQDLPDTYRMVLNLFSIEGYSHKEVAEKMGISDASSRVYLNQAKKLLKDQVRAIEHPKKVKYG